MLFLRPGVSDSGGHQQWTAAFGERMSESLPLLPRQNGAEMTNATILGSQDFGRALVQRDLVPEQQDVGPFPIVPADRGTEICAVEVLGGLKAANGKGQMKD